ncbi:unnamed protein product [Closterium sp. Yama58-4]|nr:unnamed protein product [Closterium sp. Yama58-4]
MILGFLLVLVLSYGPRDSEGAAIRGRLLTDHSDHDLRGVAHQSSLEQSIPTPGDSGDSEIPFLVGDAPLQRKLQQQGREFPTLRQITRQMLTTVKQQQQRKKQNPPKNQKTASATSKTSWPEVVGLKGEEALKQIKASVPPTWTVGIIPSGFMMTADFRSDRVNIFVDKAGIVQRPPTVG